MLSQEEDRARRRKYEADYRARNRESINAARRQRWDDSDQPEVYVIRHDGEVVYVGRTNHFERRMYEHRASSTWWIEPADEWPVRRVSIERFSHTTYADALVHEAILIREYLPTYNLDGVIR